MAETQTFEKKLVGYPVRAMRLEIVGGRDLGSTSTEGLDRIRIGTAEGNDLRLSDPTVSGFHAEIVRQADRISVIDHRSKNGTRIGPVVLRGSEASVDAGATIEIGETKLRIDEGNVVLLELGSPSGFGGVRGRSPAIRRLTASLGKLAQNVAPVLLVGESGSGKEVVARALHDESPRKERPFVVLDCGATSPSLFVSEIMGHERGAFTGAEQTRAGAFERANGGTLFIDEIGELPLEQQSALLGVLERKRVRRVGGRDEIPFDVRVVAATNRDLKGAVNLGTFRLDLYYRLAVVTLHVPPLRERTEDIALLVDHFLRDEGAEGPLARYFSPAQLGELTSHDWPGNVRELRNFVLATLAMGEAPVLGQARDPSTSAPPNVAASSGEGGGGWSEELLDARYRDARRRALDGFETAYLRRLLARSGGNVREAARIAAMDRSYLIELLSRHDLR